MRILQTLAVLFLSILLLVTLWPLFVFLVIVMIIYWIIIKNRVLKAVNDINDLNQTQSSTNPNVIDVEIVEERKE